MLMVAPRGRTKLAISLRTPSFWVDSMLKGRVPTELALENANSIAWPMPLKNLMGLTPAMTRTEVE